MQAGKSSKDVCWPQHRPKQQLSVHPLQLCGDPEAATLKDSELWGVPGIIFPTRSLTSWRNVKKIYIQRQQQSERTGGRVTHDVKGKRRNGQAETFYFVLTPWCYFLLSSHRSKGGDANGSKRHRMMMLPVSSSYIYILMCESNSLKVKNMGEPRTG